MDELKEPEYTDLYIERAVYVVRQPEDSQLRLCRAILVNTIFSKLWMFIPIVSDVRMEGYFEVVRGNTLIFYEQTESEGPVIWIIGDAEPYVFEWTEEDEKGEEANEELTMEEEDNDEEFEELMAWLND